MTPQVTPECPNEAEAARGRMDIVNLICTKRDGHELKDAEIDWIMDAYVHGAVADEQVSALLMAVFWRGLSVGELSRWTSAIIASGEKMDLSGLIAPDGGQALNRRGRRQGLAHLGPPCRGLRSRRAPAFGPWPRSHGRDSRQAGLDPRVALRAVERRDAHSARGDRLRNLRAPVPASPRQTASSTRCGT